MFFTASRNSFEISASIFDDAMKKNESVVFPNGVEEEED